MSSGKYMKMRDASNKLLGYMFSHHMKRHGLLSIPLPKVVHHQSSVLHICHYAL